MLKEKWMITVSMILLGFGVLLGIIISQQNIFNSFDTVDLNRIVNYSVDNWNDLESLQTDLLSYDFTVLDHNQKLRFRTNDNTAASLHEAIQGHYMILDVEDQGQYLGKVLINTAIPDKIQGKLDDLSLLLLTAFFLMALSILIFFIFLNQKILKPFHQLRNLALNISAGNLDIPLTMDRTNLFGPFTVSLDILREELLHAQRKEALAQKSKKELVASLSHDIKTPITSIKLISELLEVTVSTETVKTKIHTVYEKADQIDHLVSNLFQASLEELGRLEVKVTEEESNILEQLIKNADYYNLVSVTQIPECLLLIDRLRMQQIFDNIINNSFKYAGTDIEITCFVIDDFLAVLIKDFGLGVPEDELPYLSQKYFRGKRAVEEKTAGSGIGLYLACYLMEQMQGTLRFRSHSNGFVVELLIPLA